MLIFIIEFTLEIEAYSYCIKVMFYLKKKHPQNLHKTCRKSLPKGKVRHLKSRYSVFKRIHVRLKL